MENQPAPIVVFFDGECAFCDRWVNRLRDADTRRRLRFGTKQGPTFRALAQRHPEIANVESVVVLKPQSDGSETFLTRTAAVREAISGLPPFRFFATVLAILPAGVADFGYRIFSKIRRPVFGKLDHCRVPAPEERALFVD